MREGTIVNWYFKEGDEIKKETSSMMLRPENGGSAESEDEGTILKILANVGDKVKCGDPVAIVGEAGEDFADLSLLRKRPLKKKPKRQP